MTNIVVPELGESVVEARVARWLKQVGDRVEVGEPIVELETEKIDLEVNAERGGVITTIKHQEGADVKIGEVLAVMDETASGPAARPSGNGSEGRQASSPAPAASPAPPARPAPPPSPPSPTPLASLAPVAETRATPTSRNVAKNHDVNLASIQGSGAAGRVKTRRVDERPDHAAGLA